jgi:hypothetical protein
MRAFSVWDWIRRQIRRYLNRVPIVVFTRQNMLFLSCSYNMEEAGNWKNYKKFAVMQQGIDCVGWVVKCLVMLIMF